MKKLSASLFFCCVYLSAFADLTNRGRLDHKHGEFEWIIPALCLIILACVFGYFFLKDFWSKNKEEITEFLSFITISCVVGFLCHIGYQKLISTSPKFQETKNIPNDSESSTKKRSNEGNLPDGFRPVNEHDLANIGKSVQTNDPWEGYPPVITDGSQMTNKPKDFLVAAINNPTYNLHDYYVVMDMTPQNTQFLSFDRYCRSNFIRRQYSPSEFRSVYDNVQRAWAIFCSLQNTDFEDYEIIKYMYEYSPHDVTKPRIEDAKNPTLIRNLKVIPLHCSPNSNRKLGIL